MTAGNHGTFDTYDGYGKPDVRAALSYSGLIIDDPFDKLGEMGEVFEVKISGNKLNIEFGKVTNALKYNFYDNDRLLGTVPVGAGLNSVNTIEFNLLPEVTLPHRFWYVALRGNQISSVSSRITVE